MNYKRKTFTIAGITLTIPILLAAYWFFMLQPKMTEVDQLTNLPDQHSIGWFNKTTANNRHVDILPDAHITLKWNTTDPIPLQQEALTKIKSQKLTSIRVETWAGFSQDPLNVNVLEDVSNGKYDNKITALCKDLTPYAQKVILTLDPEMEVPVKDFPWQYQSPKTYIAAFRHFYQLVKTTNPNFRVMWSTAGYPGLDEYWPGEDAADAVSILLFGQAEGKTNTYPVSSNLQETIRRKLYRMRMMNKPVLFLVNQKVANPTYQSDFASATHVYQKQIDSLSLPVLEHAIEPTNSSNINKLFIGVYDPKKLLVNEKNVTTEHLFADWGNVEDGSLVNMIDEVNGRNHNLILTMEPWRGTKWPTDSNVLDRISNGYYDPIIRQTAQIVSTAKHTVFLRFAHEMEIPITRYSWQSKDPVTYIKAYRHFMNFFKDQRQVRKIWGPAGDRGSLEWWPGDAWVDYVSIAIYGLPDKNISDPLKQEAFSTIFARKNFRMRLVNKPLFITEFGVKGPTAFQTTWLNSAAVEIKKNKNISGVAYFNLADNPNVWGKMAPPNWAISKSTFHQFCVNAL